MTDEIRRALCKHNKDNPSLTQKQLQEWVHSNYGLQVSQATISNTVKWSLEYLSLAPERGDVKRHKPAKFPDLEKSLYSGSVEMEGMEDKLKFIRDKVDQFKMKDIFNMDETGLKINLHKSKLMGVGISQDLVASVARSIGCATLHTPFNYLGVKDQVVQKKASENIQKGTELGSELTSLAGSELGSELTFFAGSELGLASYRSSEDYFPATCEQELCPFNFLIASYQVSSSELSLASYRTDFASWQQRIRLYCRGKENKVNILKSIDEGPFQMGTLRETPTERTEGALHLGPERPRGYSDLTSEENDRMFKVDRIEDRGTMHGAQVQLVMGNSKHSWMLLMQARKNGVTLDEEQLLFIAGGQDNVVDDDVDEQPIQDLALNVDNVFQVDDCNAFDFDVNEALTAQTMFMANLSFADPVYDEAGPSYDLDILSEVHDHDQYQDVVCEHHEVHEMHDDVQPNYVVDSYNYYTSDSNMIPYDQYVKDNAVQVVQSDVSVVPNDAYMMILNDMHELPAQHVYVTTQTKAVYKSLTAELATYKKQVKLYERHARFKLTKREQKIDKQLRIVITDRNIKKEKLKKKLHYVKMQLASTINHNKSMVEEVTSLKKDFKQKENQYLEEFLDMKALKEKATISYKSPLCLARAKQVQPALYNGHEIIKTDHVPAIVHNSEDTLKIAKITSKKMNEKMKTPLWTHHKINIRPLDYSKENFLATFTPQTQLTLEQIFLSKDVFKMKTKALKEQAKAAKPVKALTVYPPNTPIKLVPRVLPTESQETRSEADRTLDFRALDFQITQLTEKVSVLQEQNELFRVENAKVKQHYIELNNREVHLYYLKHLKESVATLREIVEEVKVERPLDRTVASACLYTKHYQELLEYVIGTCPKDFNKRDKKQATTPLNRKKQITFADQYETSNTNTQKHVEQQITQKTNVLMLPSTRVDSRIDASGSNSRSNTKKNRISPAKSVNKNTVKDHSRTNKSHLQKLNRVNSSISSKPTVINLNFDSVCKKCNKCFILANHDMCVIKYLNYVNAPSFAKNVVRKVKQVWKPKHVKQVVQIVLWYLDLGCSKHMTGDRSRLRNFVKKFIGTVRFGNDHFGAIMGYGDYVIGDSVIFKVYYVERLGHNLFSVGQFCDSDLEVAFRRLEDMMKSSLICLLSEASKTKSRLWHHHLNHLNFGTLNDLAKKDLVRGLPRLKFEKHHFCFACQLRKSKKHTHLPKAENTNFEVLNTFRMDLCGPMRMQTINGNKYILVIVDDYTRFTWVTFLRSKYETPEVVIKFLKQLQVGLNKTVIFIHTDNGTEFVNHDLTHYYESVSIFHQKSVPRTPQQNGVVERRNRTLIEAARTMLIFSKAPMFL
nr:hypothetical protein [Tanacetum cinerariifolium]